MVEKWKRAWLVEVVWSGPSEENRMGRFHVIQVCGFPYWVGEILVVRGIRPKTDFPIQLSTKLLE